MRLFATTAMLTGCSCLAAVPAVASATTMPRHAAPACTTTLPPNSINKATIQLAGNEVLCAQGPFTNKGAITVAGTGSAVLEATDFVNQGSVSVPAGATLQLTSAPSNLRTETLTGGKWIVAGTLSLPGSISTLSAALTLSGSGEVQNSTSYGNAVDSLSKITKSAVFTLNNSAYLGTGSVTSAGTVILGTNGNSSDAVNWQDSGTFAMIGGSFTFLDPNACINVGDRAFTVTGGTMSGFGMLTGTVTVSGSAIFEPTLYGGQAGFWLDGTYTQTGGTFEDTVANPSGSPSTGVLWVSGAVSLGGALDVLSTGEKPASGTSLKVITGSPVSGNFISVQNAGVAGFSQSTSSPSASIVSMSSSPPSGPRKPHAVAKGSGKAKVSWTAPASNGGAPISGYAIVPAPVCSCKGLKVGPNANTSIVSGLHPGTKYTFVIYARNSIGAGVASVPSNSVK